MDEKKSDVITYPLCKCQSCIHFRERFKGLDVEPPLDYEELKFDFELPQIVEERAEDFKFEEIASFLENTYSPKPGFSGPSQTCMVEVIRFLTYGSASHASIINSKHILLIIETLESSRELGPVLTTINEKLALDFFRRVCTRFVQSWTAVFKGHEQAVDAAHILRRFLTGVLAFSVMTRHALNVFFDEEFWPKSVGPIQTIEVLIEKQPLCYATLSLLCNLTRIEMMPQFLEQRTKVVNMMMDKFYAHCRFLKNANESQAVLIHLWANLSQLKSFRECIIDSNAGYFMSVALPQLLAEGNLPPTVEAAIWPLLKNLSLTNEGREAIMANAEVLLGHILYPIAGPEIITPEDAPGLPLEVTDLPSCKRRVDDRKVRECILDLLYSLCRYRKDREVLRAADVYQILKHYHLAEKDESLLEKIENLVNILIRKETEEIEVDDLMEGLQVSDTKDDIPALSSKESNQNSAL